MTNNSIWTIVALLVYGGTFQLGGEKAVLADEVQQSGSEAESGGSELEQLDSPDLTAELGQKVYNVTVGEHPDGRMMTTLSMEGGQISIVPVIESRAVQHISYSDAENSVEFDVFVDAAIDDENGNLVGSVTFFEGGRTVQEFALEMSRIPGQDSLASIVVTGKGGLRTSGTFDFETGKISVFDPHAVLLPLDDGDAGQSGSSLGSPLYVAPYVIGGATLVTSPVVAVTAVATGVYVVGSEVTVATGLDNWIACKSCRFWHGSVACAAVGC